MREAISRDVRGQYSEAIKHYEAELTRNMNALIDTFLNLAFIYWQLSIEPPFYFDEGVSDKWSAVAGERYPTLLQQGLARYPQNAELHFWESYFPHILFGSALTEEDCEKIVEKYGDAESIVPYFFLWLFDKENYADKRQQLLRQCEELPTAKNRYVKSLLEPNAKSVPSGIAK